ncbi:hypothetical protein GCM10027093_43140 [Paraburkholderia jirisanensis]
MATRTTQRQARSSGAQPQAQAQAQVNAQLAPLTVRGARKHAVQPPTTNRRQPVAARLVEPINLLNS